jgi:rhodanese-related sulfurtransferase
MTEQAPTPAPEVDLDTFADAVAAGAAVLDVRNPDEYVEMHVPGAVLVPLPELGHRLEDVPPGRPLYVICASGGRSRAAANALVAQVGVEAVNVAGGTKGWVASGRAVVSGMEP